MGKTCEPKAFSIQCMTKFTTKKKKMLAPWRKTYDKNLLLLLLSHFSRVIDGQPGSAIPGILQARTLEWVAISFSNA